MEKSSWIVEEDELLSRVWLVTRWWWFKLWFRVRVGWCVWRCEASWFEVGGGGGAPLFWVKTCAASLSSHTVSNSIERT
ncbi:hypothetical protein BCR33DRAFT_710927 [Rhizoclosmatium globosum]|uniref:Uncharacterized protein n=1 Tax=Rhizoclosmatium globosum TaxID=329046 RepID=A0A1Y2D325_9FUNG|nr:hypothetical protein BCR33DRAFT_710927 [Rhizoclosmatium globosum]|eukprot:ORY53516.1 hypothetical protein BCR33DRAFT_710927 [Rhizoclosmatium globosum]